jgi:large repetitive protein
VAIRIGNNGANTLNGTNSSDIFLSFGGNDIIVAGGGNDLIFAGAGNDQIFGGDGSDMVFAGTGDDVVSGGNGNDFLFGEAGNDVLDGGRGSDIVDGGSGNDTLIFTDSERGGQDRYIGGSGQDSLVLEFTAARWADPAVKAQVLAYLDFLATGNQGTFNFTTMSLQVSSVEALVVRVDGVIIDPRAGGNTAPTGLADSYSTGENGVLTGSPSVTANDNTGTGVFTVELVTGPTRGALTLNADGTFSFNPGTDFDSLAAGQSTTETFTYRIVNSAGTSSPVTVTLNIAGANDAASISGTLTGSVTEDSMANTASGTATVTDADTGQSALGAPGTLQGTYGSLSLAASGEWIYTLDNSLAATQALGAGTSATESFAIASVDGSATSSIVITVNGTNDGATFDGETTGTIPEDDDTRFVVGTVIVNDVDAGQAAVGNAGIQSGTYGSLTLTANGDWVYAINNELAATQALGEGDTATETFTVTSADGSATTSITISVNGTNDEAVISGDLEGTVTEDDLIEDDGFVSNPRTSGQITVEDVDTGEAAIRNPSNYEGAYGTLFLNEDGGWTYVLDNDAEQVQGLGEGDIATDTFTVTSIDGTSQNLVITINGINDVPEITGDLGGSIFEDQISSETEALETTIEGQVFISDRDAGESGLAFEDSITVGGAWGELLIDEDGSWVYELSNSLEEIQGLGEGDSTTDDFVLLTTDGTEVDIQITINGQDDAAVIEGDLSGDIILSFEQSTATGEVLVTDLDFDESGVVADTYEGDYGTVAIDADGFWLYTLTNFEIPFEGEFDIVTDTITLQTLGGDLFDINIAIQQEGFIIG